MASLYKIYQKKTFSSHVANQRHTTRERFLYYLSTNQAYESLHIQIYLATSLARAKHPMMA
ncbi:hypothetical protein HMPREF9088_2012 [Enterococcus italicus DSM 15952]|uniref:Uncharacterized protein n=1 Tax=Enterococcus italicus (strain DSM 15952 / CCUG 50447 / LMG 22039 / TP 1.5) TaxID=888064 RepID=E6LI22_ENTI1|nr:hypothetical protein HMPREF9088_2012 [Enterococcus italicus DSM 15952]